MCGSPRVKGVYIYEESQIKYIFEKEFDIATYLKGKECYSLYNVLLSGKILEISYLDNQFVLELFCLYRANHRGMVTKVLEECVIGESLFVCLQEIDQRLDSEMSLVRNRI